VSLCAYCYAPASTQYTARGGREHPYRAILACPAHRTKARAWAARAGPPTETPTTHHQQHPAQPHLF
jgi:hypothetical protein